MIILIKIISENINVLEFELSDEYVYLFYNDLYLFNFYLSIFVLDHTFKNSKNL
jgi:hypothetical protein